MNKLDVDEQIYSLGLVGSGIGIGWIKKENGNYLYHHTESTSDLFNQKVQDLPPVIIYGEKWNKIAERVYKINSAYKNLILKSTELTQALLRGEITHCNYKMPWLDSDGKLIWLFDQLYLLDKDKDGTAQTVIAITVNESTRLSRRDKYQTLEELNVKLKSANERAISLSNLLVWSMNYDEFPKGDYIFCNQPYADALGIDINKDGYIKFKDFLKSTYVDLEGSRTMQALLDEFEKARRGISNEYLGLLVKHRNLKTREAVYLEHYTRVDDRYDDGSIRRIGGYIVDITNRLTMERKNEELDRKNKELMIAQKLAMKSGKVMIWYINSEESQNDNYFFGNDLLFTKLGIKKQRNSRFLIRDFNKTIYQDDDEGKSLATEYFKTDDLLEDNKLQSYEKVLVKHQNLKTKEIFYFEHNSIVEERFPNGSLKVRGGFMNDVTNETVYKMRIEFLVEHDVVTGLLNRNMFEKYIDSKDLPDNYTLLVFDIDGLKFINDAFGHLKGDEVIKLLGSILSDEFNDDSKSFRIGGDEFAVITKDIHPLSVEDRVQKVRDKVSEFAQSSKLAFSISTGYEIVTNNYTPFLKAFTMAENVMYRRKLGDRNSRKSKTMETVLETLNTKTEETKAHCDRLGKYAVAILKQIGYSRMSDLEDINLLCQVHDIGKITIAEEILSKTGKLTDEEYQKIKSHSEAGYKIVKNIVESDTIANGVLYHHERHDGKGYPFGLKEKEIPLFARIISVCDAYDVMVSGRTYQESRSKEEAIKELVACSGTQFDPEIVEAFIITQNKK